MVDFLVANFLSNFPGKIGLNFVTESFTTFFTPRRSLHAQLTLQLTLGASSPIQPVEGATKRKGSTKDLYVGAEPFLHESGPRSSR